jgi:hypothetical protein
MVFDTRDRSPMLEWSNGQRWQAMQQCNVSRTGDNGLGEVQAWVRSVLCVQLAVRDLVHIGCNALDTLDLTRAALHGPQQSGEQRGGGSAQLTPLSRHRPGGGGGNSLQCPMCCRLHGVVGYSWQWV